MLLVRTNFIEEHLSTEQHLRSLENNFHAQLAGNKKQEVNRTTVQMENVSQQLSYNQSFFNEFIFVGGEVGLKEFYTELGVFLLVVYLLVLTGNLMVCAAVVLETKLHTPMYVLLTNLSLADIIITSSVLPKMINVGLMSDTTISFSGCFLQQMVYLGFQAIECILLGVMAFDRYAAICNPLRYADIMNLRICIALSVATWISGILVPLPIVIKSALLPYCGNEIMFWFCDFPPVIALSCIDTTSLLFLALGNALLVISLPGILIIWTYTKIILAVCKIKSVDGRKKAFSTCSSHISVVIIFYSAHMIVYISSTVNDVHPNVLILVSIMNVFLTPFANPIIYSLRNKELKNAIQKHFFCKKVVM